ncbi:MAG: undecaprenyl/decaprenyl-phosphate alpha-N-acetylglucosaminyl 1-phosphate transferase [Candidatus Omnitrophica bacterium]|nr:undecaprenyl/decaprenyl-phosphate alpha-N-acetylglucosaminyl 1-phosphate transferase [Candidatus Omnitrophota bacterium]
MSTFIFTQIAIRIGFKFNVLDRPEKRKIHVQPVPLLGGLALAIPYLLILFVIRNEFDIVILSVLFGGLIILIVGFLDDLNKLSARLRLGIQILVVLMLITNSATLTIFPNTAWGIILRCLITILWIVGITNAMNFLDGMDALCAGLVCISSLCFAVIAFFTNQNQILFLSIILFGCCLGFLPHNLKPAKVFLGDSGSTFLGFMLASIAVVGVWAQDRIVGISIPILILGVPIFDMVFTTVMRVKEGKVKNVKQWLEYAGKDHFHHRLVDLGLQPQGAVIFIYLVSICLGISAMVLLRATWKIAIILLIQAAAIFLMIAVLMIIGKRRRSGWNIDKLKAKD